MFIKSLFIFTIFIAVLLIPTFLHNLDNNLISPIESNDALERNRRTSYYQQLQAKIPAIITNNQAISITPTPHVAAIPANVLFLTPTPFDLSISPTLAPISTISPVPRANAGYWEIQSVSSMKLTKDSVCNQPSDSFISRWVAKAAELGVNYIAVETPYESPSCGDVIAYTKRWNDAIRAQGIHVWHRHMPLAFEGIYDTAKTTNIDLLQIMTNYITANPELFAAGDIFTPIPEPQNGGIENITYCAQNICQFSSKEKFNGWLRTAMTQANLAFGTIGLKDKLRIGYFGFDGFVAWGDNNADWTGILEDATVAQMGNITIDHYPEAVGDTMENDLNELERRYPGVKIVIGEWGTTTSGDSIQMVKNTMSAAHRASVVGFNYWHMGIGGNEALINDDFSKRPAFDSVKSFFTASN